MTKLGNIFCGFIVLSSSLAFAGPECDEVGSRSVESTMLSRKIKENEDARYGKKKEDAISGAILNNGVLLPSKDPRTELIPIAKEMIEEIHSNLEDADETIDLITLQLIEDSVKQGGEPAIKSLEQSHLNTLNRWRVSLMASVRGKCK